MSKVLALSSNLRTQSRTHRAGLRLAEALAAGGPVSELEVITVADGIFTAPGERPAKLREAMAALQAAELAIIATPVYKASYTGLLKAFLDLYSAGDLAGVVAVPVVVSGSPAHAFVGEIHLRPVLTELGATVATPAFTVTESRLDELDDLVADWARRHRPVIDRLLGRG